MSDSSASASAVSSHIMLTVPTFSDGVRCDKDGIEISQRTRLTGKSQAGVWRNAIANEHLSRGRNVFGWRILDRATCTDFVLGLTNLATAGDRNCCLGLIPSDE